MYDKLDVNILTTYLYFKNTLQGQYYGYNQPFVERSYFIWLQMFHNLNDDRNSCLRWLGNCKIDIFCSSGPVLWIYLEIVEFPYI